METKDKTPALSCREALEKLVEEVNQMYDNNSLFNRDDEIKEALKQAEQALLPVQGIKSIQDCKNEISKKDSFDFEAQFYANSDRNYWVFVNKVIELYANQFIDQPIADKEQLTLENLNQRIKDLENYVFDVDNMTKLLTIKI